MRILQIYWISSIIIQIVLALIMGFVAGIKNYYYGYETKCDDGEGILVLMFCTFLFLTAPITVWFVVGWFITETHEIFDRRRKYLLLLKQGLSRSEAVDELSGRKEEREKFYEWDITSHNYKR